MRIIAGDHRGRPLLGPADAKTTRPIIDRVKESLFNRLASLGLLQPDGENEGWSAVDVFCGTGSMGLECLSRGAASCTFVDQDRVAIGRLEDNIETLGVQDRAHVVQASALAGYWSASIQESKSIIEPGGVVVLRTPIEVACEEIPGYDGPAKADYGGMWLHFYQTPIL